MMVRKMIPSLRQPYKASQRMGHLVYWKWWLWGLVFTMLSRLVNHVLEPYISHFVIVYLDDICIYYETHEQQINHLRLVF